MGNFNYIIMCTLTYLVDIFLVKFQLDFNFNYFLEIRYRYLYL